MLVNNAGITRDAVLHKMTEEQWNEVIHVNRRLLIFNMTRNVIEGMRERSYGRVVNSSSINGQKGQMGQTNYSAAKAGMIGFTKALAQENAKKGITVNAIMLPATSTPRWSRPCPWPNSIRLSPAFEKGAWAWPTRSRAALRSWPRTPGFPGQYAH